MLASCDLLFESTDDETLEAPEEVEEVESVEEAASDAQEETQNEEVNEEEVVQTEQSQDTSYSNDNSHNRIPVTLSRVVDGDSVNVYHNGEELKLRLLLMDTPESVHPNKPVEPYAIEASNRMKELVAQGNLSIEYDTGDQTDHYGRHLVYLYSGDTNLNGQMIEEGYARVGYIYEQQRHLDTFYGQQQYAKDNNLRIWSMNGYVNEGGEGFNSHLFVEEETSTPAQQNQQNQQTQQTQSDNSNSGGYNFKNCTELREVFPNGVQRGHEAYQSKMDRDNDGHACE